MVEGPRVLQSAHKNVTRKFTRLRGVATGCQNANYSEERAFDIEKVLEMEESESKVKCLGWPEKFNSWIPMSEVTLHPDNTLEDDAEEDGED